MNLKFCTNIAENEYEMILHGVVGEEINGRDVAREIYYLDSIGAKKIKERINTIGGTVVDAFSIVSANISSKCEIHTMNEGVADSAGSFILASGDKGCRGAYDFATMLIHNPSYDGVPLEEIPDGKLKSDLTMMRDSIVTILVNNGDKTRDEIITKMNESARMSAEEAKKFGLIDFVEKSVKKPALTENMSMAEIMNVCTELYKKPENLKIENNMKQIAKYLNLNEDAAESSVLNTVQAIQNRAEKAEKALTGANDKVVELTSEVESLTNQATEKDTEITALKAQVAEFQTREVENAVQNAITSGKFAEENKEGLIEKANTMGIENFNSMVDMMVMPHVDVVGQVKNQGVKPKKGDEKEKELAEKYQNLAENDPMELSRIKNESPSEFEKMFNAWNEA